MLRRGRLLRRIAALHPVRLARPIARHPGRVALAATAVCAVAATGFARFGVDAGTGLLVGSQSDAGRTYSQLATHFGSDPVVVVFSARNPRAFYAEQNLLRLAALESALSRDPRVASVMGPGTIAGSAQQGAASEVARVLNEYSAFVGETELLTLENQGDKNANDVLQKAQSATQAAQLALLQSVVRATGLADSARDQVRQAISQNPGKYGAARLIDSWEQSAEQAASQADLPPLFADYLGAAEGHTGKPDDAGARALFDRLTAGYGDCYDQVAGALGLKAASCQVFLERVLLDLPHCPSIQSQSFCPPKPQWAAVLPAARAGDPSRAILTVRLRQDVAASPSAVRAVVADIRDQLDHGRPHDSNANVRGLGALDPSECAGNRDQSTTCMQQLHDAPLTYVVAGAPLLAAGVVGATTHLLIGILPVAFLVMLLLLLGLFRARGRMWPLPAAGAAVLLTVGLALLLGASVTPAVLAGVPVLVGLGVDYGVQLLARFQEERGRGLGIEASLRQVLGRTGPATLVAAAATVAGLAAMALLTGVDLGPLAAIPLVAEFAVVLLVGVVVAWLSAVLIALPAAAWRERRREDRGELPEPAAAAAPGPAPRAERTARLADRWRLVLVPAAVLALVGWAVMPRVPVQTDAERLLAPSLQELQDVQQVRAQTGYDNELDVLVQGPALGPYDQATPGNAVWQREVAQELRCVHPQIVQATSIADMLSAGGDAGTGSTNPCQSSGGSSGGTSPSTPSSPSPSASGSPRPSGNSSPSPAVSPSPQSRVPDDVVRAGAVRPLTEPGQAVASAAAGPTAATSVAPSAAASAATPAPSAGAASPGPTPATAPPAQAAPRATVPQTPFICALRLFPMLSASLVDGFGPKTLACPPRDLFRNSFLAADPTPVTPGAARIALGIQVTSVADEASLIDSMRHELANAPAGITAAPTGLGALAAQAYDNLTTRALMLNLVPLVVVALVLLAIYREPRRALLPVLPTALAAGWAPLVVVLLGRLPGDAGATLGSLNPLTVVLGALVVALATEFGVVLLQRFHEELERGLDADAAAAAALGGVGRAVRVSALTLGAGFAVLAVSGLAPGGLPLIADFGLAVVIDLALAVAAVFLVMLPVAVALERHRETDRELAGVPARAGMATAAVAVAQPRVPGRRAGGRSARRAARRGRPEVETAAVPAAGAVEPAVAAAEPAALEPVEEDTDAGAVEAPVAWTAAGVDAAEAVAAPGEELTGRGRERSAWAVVADPPWTPAVSPDDEETAPGGGGVEEWVGDTGAAPAQPAEPVPAVTAAPRPAAPEGVGTGPASAARRLPGMSGRRRPVAPPPPPPGRPAQPDSRPGRLPGLSGRRRAPLGEPPAAASIPPTPTDAVAAPGPAAEPPRRRRPGSVIPRRPAPAGDRPPAQLATGQPPAPEAPTASTTAGAPADEPAPPGPEPRRPRRRRPPPHIRRQGR